MAFAKAGDTTSALQLVQQLREKYPLNTLLRDRDLPSIQAEIYLQQGRPDLAIAVLEPAVPYELGLLQQFALDSVYVRGEAYLQAGKGTRGGVSVSQDAGSSWATCEFSEWPAGASAACPRAGDDG